MADVMPDRTAPTVSSAPGTQTITDEVSGQMLDGFIMEENDLQERIKIFRQKMKISQRNSLNWHQQEAETNFRRRNEHVEH
jgi:hypothetical protein